MAVHPQAFQVLVTLLDGGVAVVPTTAGYGLLAMGPEAVARIYAMKGRPRQKPCVTVTTWPVFDDVALPIDPAVRARIEDTITWAPLAVVAPTNPRSRLLASLHPFVLDHCTQDGTIATFHAAGALVMGVATLAYAMGRLVVGSSGNRSGCGNAYTLDEVPTRGDADLVIDHGPIQAPGGERLATTIVDLQTGRFLREGLQFAAIRRAWAA